MLTTKSYTKPVLLKNLKNINVRSYKTYETFVNSFSPRAGAKSAKILALKTAIGVSSLEKLFINDAKTVKGLLIYSLKNA